MIFWEDMRSRMVHWFWFPLLAAGLVALRYRLGEGLPAIALSSAVSFAFIVVQLLLVSLYFSLKAKRWVNITENLLGWGDVLLLVSLAFYFTLPVLTMFYISSLIIILIGWIIYQRVLPQPSKFIPLAGLQAAMLLLTVLVQWIRPDWLFFDVEALIGGWAS
jgi:hypothetical protein